jgi:hypothetical protein
VCLSDRAPAVQLIDEIHVPVYIELDAFVRSARNHVLVAEVRADVLEYRGRAGDARLLDRVLQLEQAAVRKRMIRVRRA